MRKKKALYVIEIIMNPLVSLLFMKELAYHLQELIANEKMLLESDAVAFPVHFGESVPFSKHHFHSIPPCHDGEGVMSSHFVSFVDGGNAEIIKAASFSIHLVRAYGSVYKNKQKQFSMTVLYSVLVQTISDNGKLLYKASCFPLSSSVLPLFPQTFLFDTHHDSMRDGVSFASPSIIGGIIRRYMELHLAEELCKAIQQGTLVLDGSLQKMYQHDDTFFSSLLESVEKYSVTLLGVSKTSDLRTMQGRSVLGLLHHHGPPGAWIYYPLLKEAKETLFDVCFVKWHPASRYPFRVDVHALQGCYSDVSGSIDRLQTILSGLSWNAADPLFLGYPYGLLEADQFARISHQEQQYYETILKALVSKDAKEVLLEKWTAAATAHTVLDTAQF